MWTKQDIINHYSDCVNYNMVCAKIHVYINLMRNTEESLYKLIFSQGVFKESLGLAVFIANGIVKQKIQNYVSKED